MRRAGRAGGAMSAVTVERNTERDGRYNHLLQPIRDLAMNWDVDIANELAEYADELKNITYSLDDGRKLNFAEAALLIQGSAMIYSRKVEYLYTLTHQTLEMMAEKKKQQQRDRLPEDDESLWGRDVDEFLTLDDLTPAANIDVVEDAAAMPARNLLSRTPIAFLPSMDRSSGHLLSSKGDVIGRKDDFRMNTSVIADNGALLLDSTIAAQAAVSIRSPPVAAVAAVPDAEMHIRLEDFPVEEGGFGGPDHEMDDDDDELALGGGGDFGAGGAGSDDELGGGNRASALPLVGGNVDDPEDELGVSGGDFLDLASPSFVGKSAGRNALNMSLGGDYADPWAQMDPHATIPSASKPMRIGKTYRLPKIADKEAEGAEPTTKSGRRTAKQLQKEQEGEALVLPVVSVDAFLESMAAAEDPKGAATVARGPNFMAGPSFREFDYLYTRAARKSTGSRAPRGFRSVVAPGDLNFSIGALSDDDDDGERPGFGGDFEVNMDDFVPTLSLGGGAVDLGAAPAQAETNAPSDSDFTQTYEDLCRAKIESYLLSAQRYEQQLETNMSRRVREWEDKLQAVLKEQEKQPFFDVHKYGEGVLESFSTRKMKKNAVLPLETVAGKDATPAEVIRVFIASLHLVNAGNVELQIGKDDADGEAPLLYKLKSLDLRQFE